MADPNVYQGPGSGGTHHNRVNVVAATQLDNTGGAGIAAKVNAFLISLALLSPGASGQVCWFPDGIYNVDAPIVPQNGQTIESSAGARFVSSQPPTGQNTSCIIFAAPTPLAVPNLGTIHTPPTVGATTVVVDLATSKPVVGHWISLGYPGAGINNSQTFKIMAVAGATTPYTVTLDRPILYPFTSGGNALTGSIVQEYRNIPQNIHWYGNGCVFTGTGDLYIELLSALGCHIQDVNMDTSGGHPDGGGGGCAVDVGSRNCRVVGLTCDLTGALPWAGFVAPYGILIDSTENSVAIDCRASNCAGGASFYVDGVAGACAQNCHDEGGSAIGFQFGDTLGLGAFDCVTLCCSAASPIGFDARQSTAAMIIGCSARGTAQAIVIDPGAVATQIKTFDASNVTTHALSISNDVDVDGLVALGITSVISVIEMGAGKIVRLKNVRIQGMNNINGVVTDGGFTGRCEISSMAVEMDGAGSFGIYHQGGVILADNVKTSGTGGGCTGAAVAVAGATLRLGVGNDFSSCATPLSVTGGAFCNRKQTAPGSAGGTQFAWPDIKATDVALFMGQNRTPPNYTIQAGAGVTIVDTGNNTWEYYIP